jgi:hypothetical protein
MKTAVRNIAGDLVEKRLWPVAVALIVGIVAIPLVLTRGGAPAPTAAAGAAAAPAAGQDTAAVTLVESSDGGGTRAGHVRNPFGTAADAAGAAASTASTAASAAGPSAGPSGGPSAGASRVAATATRPARSATSSAGTGASARPSTGTSPRPSGSAGSSSSTPKPTTTTAPRTTKRPTPAKATAVDATDTYHVSLRFGVNGALLETIKDVARLSPLPSETDPFFVFLGVLQTEKTHERRAVFMVSSDAVPTGEGACHPTRQDCETIELAKGETVFFDYTAPDGTPTQYELDLAGIHRTRIAGAAKAQAAIARHSAVGQELLRDAATRNDRAAAGARAYRFVPATGLLVRAKRAHVTAKAAAAGTLIPGLALVDGKDQPGIPVWRSPKKHARAR